MSNISKGRKKSQCNQLLKKLQRKKGITSLEAFQELGITSLHRRLTDLRQSGYEISGAWHYKMDSNGRVEKKWKVYRLVA